MNKDYIKYIKSSKVNLSYVTDYNKKIQQKLYNDISPNFDVFNHLLEDRIIFLWGEIDDYISELIKANLLYLDSINNDDISIYINSPGGSVYSGLGLLDVMDFVESDVSTVNTGLAASMASVLLCSGKKGKRKSLKRSRTMIHQPMSGYSGWAQASDIEIEAKEINHLKKEMYEIISERTGQDYEKVYNDGDRDYWMSSKDALKYGMIDKIVIKKGD
jgi:ATP-dependent Clp protease protease subunit